MIVKLARYQVRKDALPQTLQLVHAFVDEVTRKEGGTARYEAFQAKDDPTRFTHYMTFRTPAADQYHQKTAWAKRFFEALAPLCVAAPSVEELTPVP
ncbi:MAG TPA: antibiotic biosynthesis monooxygenase [Candidatus Thermoplasmatota archaeon]|nr:antibiotic biosynthesis monooxygenase [Candidatus Thermoplasmatota archaeon]